MADNIDKYMFSQEHPVRQIWHKINVIWIAYNTLKLHGAKEHQKVLNVDKQKSQATFEWRTIVGDVSGQQFYIAEDWGTNELVNLKSNTVKIFFKKKLINNNPILRCGQVYRVHSWKVMSGPISQLAIVSVSRLWHTDWVSNKKLDIEGTKHTQHFFTHYNHQNYKNYKIKILNHKYSDFKFLYAKILEIFQWPVLAKGT